MNEQRGITRGGPLAGVLAALLLCPSASADCVDGRPLNIGHRGTGNSTLDNPYPENTLPSLLAAAAEGATMVEIDIGLSADAVPVLMHDTRVDATTDGTGCVSELTLDELLQLDAGAGTPMEGAGVQIPTLEQVLGSVALDLNLELKLGGADCPMLDDPQFISAILDVLDDDPMERQILMSSFDFPVLQEVRSQDPQVAIGQLSISPASAMPAAEAGFDVLVLADGSVDQAAVMTARDAGLDLIAWTVDDPTRQGELLALDVDGIITNDPPTLEQTRAEACPGLDDSGEATGDTSGQIGETDPLDGSGATMMGPPGDTGDTTPQDEDDAGCSCRTRPERGSALMMLTGLALLLPMRRRRDGDRRAQPQAPCMVGPSPSPSPSPSSGHGATPRPQARRSPRTR